MSARRTWLAFTCARTWTARRFSTASRSSAATSRIVCPGLVRSSDIRSAAVESLNSPVAGQWNERKFEVEFYETNDRAWRFWVQARMAAERAALQAIEDEERARIRAKLEEEEKAKRAQDGKLTIEELTGGTFSISNGGTFGSMLSTPIINPPQSAILGVHATKDRPVAENGQVVIRPMNYLALSYDHRIIDGREAVLALVAMKEALEDPARLLLDI